MRKSSLKVKKEKQKVRSSQHIVSRIAITVAEEKMGKRGREVIRNFLDFLGHKSIAIFTG